MKKDMSTEDWRLDPQCRAAYCRTEASLWHIQRRCFLGAILSIKVGVSSNLRKKIKSSY